MYVRGRRGVSGFLLWGRGLHAGHHDVSVHFCFKESSFFVQAEDVPAQFDLIGFVVFYEISRETDAKFPVQLDHRLFLETIRRGDLTGAIGTDIELKVLPRR